MPSRPSSEPGTERLPQDLAGLRAALARGERSFRGLRLGDLDGVDLDLSGCELSGGCFKEARIGHASLHGATVEGCCFQLALLSGADLSEPKAARSFWHDAGLSAARLQGADFSMAILHRCCLWGGA